MISHKQTICRDKTQTITSTTTNRNNKYCASASSQPFQVIGTLYLQARDKYKKRKSDYYKPVLQLTSDINKVTLTSKDNCMILQGIPVTMYGNYKSGDDIKAWKEDNIIKDYTEPHYLTHHARTVEMTGEKGTSDLIFNIIKDVIETPDSELHDNLLQPIIDKYIDITKDHPKSQKNSPNEQYYVDMIYALEYRDIVDKEAYHQDKQIRNMMALKRKIDKNPNKFESALELLNTWFPLRQGGSKNYIVDKLYNYLNPEEREEISQQSIVKVVKASGTLSTQDINIEGSIESDIYEIQKCMPYIETITNVPTEYPVNNPCTSLPLVLATSTFKTTSLPFNPINLINSYNYKVSNHPDFLNIYNNLALKFLSTYEPSNELERRCKQVMVGTGKAFPLSYLRLSSCPRLYAEGKDNLFYCPSVMRQSLSKELNLREWDMKSCHTNILLGLYGEHFPILSEMVKSDSIWKDYEDYFINNKCTFNKSVVKAFHYATVLGGGKQAYKEALKKLVKEGIKLTEGEAKQYISIFSSHPVVKEMKGFINQWGYWNKKKQIEYPNGESHDLILPKTVTNPSTGKKVKDYTNSNVLKVFSGLLRAWEMVLISYVGLSHPEAFTILLHQHDGITVVEDIPNAFELAQEAMREISVICFPNLYKPIELEIKI